MLITLFLPSCFIKNYAFGINTEVKRAFECIYVSQFQNMGVNLFTLICNNDSVLFYNNGCQRFIELLNGTNQESDILLTRMEKHFSERNEDYMLNGNVLYWEHLLFDYGKGVFTLYNSHSRALLSYEERISPLPWKMIPDTSIMILGYTCKYATINYRGRHWKVWYTEEIPLSYGPWKLHGLPGLIMRATVDSLINFEVTSIKTCKINAIKKVLETRDYKYEHITREKYLKFRNTPLVIPTIKKKFKVSTYLELE